MENIQRIGVGNNRYLDLDEAPPINVLNLTVDSNIVTADSEIIKSDNQ